MFDKETNRDRGPRFTSPYNGRYEERSTSSKGARDVSCLDGAGLQRPPRVIASGCSRRTPPGRRRSPRTSRRSSRQNASRAIGPTTWRRCRCVTYEDARPWAQVDRVARRRAADAAVAHRQDGRHPEVQERSLAQRRADRHDPARGSPPARRRATRRTCRRRKSGKTRRAGSMADKYGAAGSRRQVARRTRCPPVAQDAWWRPTVPTGLTEPRWVRAIEIRPVGKNARKITHHALARLQQPEDMDPALFTNDPERRRRRPVHGMGGRQERRRDASRTRAA